MRKKRWLFVAGAVLAAGALWYRFGPLPGGDKNPAKTGKNAKAAPSRAVKVERGDVTLALRETGTVTARVSVDVRTRVSGNIRELFVQEGDVVEEGRRLAVIEPDVNEALRLAERRTRVEEIRRNLEQRREDLERLRRLHGEGFISQQELDRAEVEYANAQRGHELERASLDALEREYSLPAGGAASSADGRAALADFYVTSPISGVVTKALVKAGELVTSGVSGLAREGSHLMTIADVSDMVVSSQLSEVDVSKVREGSAASVTFPSMPGITLGAQLERASFAGNRDERNLVRFPVTVRLDDPKHPALRPGISCNVDIEVDRRENVLRIPLLALVEKDGKASVNMKIPSAGPEGAKKAAPAFEPREITVGLRGDAFVEVLDGLAEGDEIAANFSGEKAGSEGLQQGSQRRRMR
jgi:HlyD family secretion protein